MKILVTGSAGFIGSALTMKLLEQGMNVVGIDNLNDYYNPALKKARLARHENHPNYRHLTIDLVCRESIGRLFIDNEFDMVINLAAQAGVRHSISNPYSYIDSNLVGFGNILEECRRNNIKHLVYASSSSVYGLNSRQPFSTHDSVDHPVSLYAATKKANELMAHSYSHLYGLPTTGLRFFTVYGPFDRPDMALQKFTRAILNNETIKVYNFGNHHRDFTYIDDIVEGIFRVSLIPAKINHAWNSSSPDPSSSSAPFKIYNIGNNKPIKLLDYIKTLEKFLEKEARIELLPLQPGDVLDTYADINDLIKDFDYKPTTSIQQGIENFVRWYKQYNFV